MNWISKFFSRNQITKQTALSSIEHSLQESQEQVEQLIGDLQRETQKSLRRLNLDQKRQIEVSEHTSEQLGQLLERIYQDKALVLDLKATISLLDELNQVQNAIKYNSIAQELLNKILAEIQTKAMLAPICKLGEPYPENHCQVVGTIEMQGLALGCIASITEQGYIYSSDKVIRSAKVVVNGPAPQ